MNKASKESEKIISIKKNKTLSQPTTRHPVATKSESFPIPNIYIYTHTMAITKVHNLISLKTNYTFIKTKTSTTVKGKKLNLSHFIIPSVP